MGTDSAQTALPEQQARRGKHSNTNSEGTCPLESHVFRGAGDYVQLFQNTHNVD